MENTINFDLAVNTALADSGSPVDVLALAVGFSTYGDLLVDNLDCLDEHVQQAINKLDHEEIFIEHVNNHPELLPEEAATLFPSSTLKAGAFFALSFPDAFDTSLAAFVKEQKALVHESAALEPYTKAADEARGYFENDLFDLFLKGDRSSGGVLQSANERYGGEFSYDRKTGTVHVSIDAQGAYDLLNNGDQMDETEVISGFCSMVNDNANTNIEMKMRKANERAEAYRLTTARKQAQEEAARAAREEKLRAMTK